MTASQMLIQYVQTDLKNDEHKQVYIPKIKDVQLLSARDTTLPPNERCARRETKQAELQHPLVTKSDLIHAGGYKIPSKPIPVHYLGRV